VWLDYARVIVSALWKRLDPESIVKNKEKVFTFQNKNPLIIIKLLGWAVNDQQELGACQVHNRAALPFAAIIMSSIMEPY